MQSLREKILIWRDVLRCYRVRPKRVAIGLRVIANEVMAAQAPKFSHPTKSGGAPEERGGRQRRFVR